MFPAPNKTSSQHRPSGVRVLLQPQLKITLVRKVLKISLRILQNCFWWNCVRSAIEPLLKELIVEGNANDGFRAHSSDLDKRLKAAHPEQNYFTSFSVQRQLDLFHILAFHQRDVRHRFSRLQRRRYTHRTITAVRVCGVLHSAIPENSSFFWKILLADGCLVFRQIACLVSLRCRRCRRCRRLVAAMPR